MRELQLMDAANGVADMFADILELGNQCRFSNCNHDGVPVCAIQAAMERREWDPMRLARWQKLTARNYLSARDTVFDEVGRTELTVGRLS